MKLKPEKKQTKTKKNKQTEKQKNTYMMKKQVSISKNIYLNCWEKHEDMIDHRSYMQSYLSESSLAKH